jgi:hypothetical protein
LESPLFPRPRRVPTTIPWAAHRQIPSYRYSARAGEVLRALGGPHTAQPRLLVRAESLAVRCEAPLRVPFEVDGEGAGRHGGYERAERRRWRRTSTSATSARRLDISPIRHTTRLGSPTEANWSWHAIAERSSTGPRLNIDSNSHLDWHLSSRMARFSATIEGSFNLVCPSLPITTFVSDLLPALHFRPNSTSLRQVLVTVPLCFLYRRS